MGRKELVAGIAVVALSWSIVAHGALTVSLSSNDNLANLFVEQSFTVDVSLSGLLAGERLSTSTAGVNYSPALLSAPSITAGAIVPVPLANPLDFQAVPGAGQADASFVTFSLLPAHHITSNGVFYSFTVQTTAVGSGQFSFNLPALIGEQYNVADPQNPVLRFIDTGGPLAFSVQIPEGGPSLLIGSVLGLAALRRRRS